MTIPEFKRDIESRTDRYACLGEATPVQAIMHISEVAAAEDSAVISFIDGINKVELSRIQSICLDNDHYLIICGEESFPIRVTIRFGDSVRSDKPA